MALATLIAATVASTDVPSLGASGEAGAVATQTGTRGEGVTVPLEWRVTPLTSNGSSSDESIVFGMSGLGRELTVVHRQGAAPTRSVMVVGVIHGDEVFGRRVTDGLTTAAIPADLDLWIVPTINPDGETDGRHGNANRVDLNRNFPTNWQTGTYYSSGKYFSGVAPASEAETRALMALIGAVRPDVVVWYHSPWNRVDCDIGRAGGRLGGLCGRFAGATNLSASFAPRPGTATDWVMTTLGTPSFVVEFGASAPAAATVARHVRALLDIEPA